MGVPLWVGDYIYTYICKCMYIYLLPPGWAVSPSGLTVPFSLSHCFISSDLTALEDPN
jgi:hypothetical protein